MEERGTHTGGQQTEQQQQKQNPKQTLKPWSVFFFLRESNWSGISAAASLPHTEFGRHLPLIEPDPHPTSSSQGSVIHNRSFGLSRKESCAYFHSSLSYFWVWFRVALFCCVGFLKQGFSVALLFLYPEAVRPSPACVHYVWARQRPVCAPGELVSTLPYCECVCVPVSMREPKFSTRLILHKSCLGNHCFCELTCAIAMMSRGHCFTKQLYFTHQKHSKEWTVLSFCKSV